MAGNAEVARVEEDALRRATALQVGLAALLCGALLGIDAPAGLAVDDTRSEIVVTWTGNGTAWFRTTNSSYVPDGKIDCQRQAEMTTGTCSAKYRITVSQVIYWRMEAASESLICPSSTSPAPCVYLSLDQSFVLGYNEDVSYSPKVVLQHPTVLNVTRSGTGMGTVTSDPLGIDCGVDCWGEFPDGRDVTLSVAWDPDSKFVGWSGACVATTPTCTFNLDTASTVDAKFDLVVATTPSPNPTAPPTAAPVASASTPTAVPATPATTQGDGTPTEPPVGGVPTDLPGAGSSSAGPPSAGPVAVGGSDASAGPEPAGGGAAGPLPGEIDPAAGGDGFLAGLFVGGLVMLVVIAGAVGAWLWRRRRSPPVAG